MKMFTCKNLKIFCSLLILWILPDFDRFTESNTDFQLLREKLHKEVGQKNSAGVKNVIKDAESQNINVHVLINEEVTPELNAWRVPLQLAAWQNDFDTVEFLVKKGAEINKSVLEPTSKFQYYTALEIAAENNYLKIAKYLLENGASISGKDNASTKLEETSLHLACKKNNLEMVDLILKFKGDVNVQTTRGVTPLCYAIESGDMEMVLKLLNAGANIQVVDTHLNLNALHAVSKIPRFNRDNTEALIKLFLKKGANLKKPNFSGKTPLEYAIEKRNYETTKFLIKNGAQLLPSYLVTSDSSPLHGAVETGDLELVQIFLNASANVAERSTKMSDNTVLHTVSKAEQNVESIIKLLLENGAGLDVKNKEGLTPLQYAIKELNFEALQALNKSGAHYEHSYLATLKDFTHLFKAVKQGNLAMVELCLKVGANVMGTENHSNASLLHAIAYAKKNMDPLVKLLLEKGLSIEKQDRSGETPLSFAMLRQNLNASLVLLKNGAFLKPSLLDMTFFEKTPLFQAVIEGNLELVDIFLKAGANLTVVNDEKNYSMLHGAALAKRNIEPMLRLLLEKGLDLEKKDTDGLTPLKLSMKQRNFEASNIFVKNGAYLESSYLIENYAADSNYLFEAITEGHVEKVRHVSENCSNLSNGFSLHAVAYAEKNIGQIIDILLRQSAEREKKDKFGLTPLQFAIIRRNFEASKALIKFGAELNLSYLEKNFVGFSPLFDAVKKGDLEIIEMFLKAGADVTIGNGEKNYTALHAVSFVQKNIGPIIKLLIEKGADLEQESKEGKTALDIAKELKNVEASKVLNLYAVLFNKIWRRILILTIFCLVAFILFLLFGNVN